MSEQALKFLLQLAADFDLYSYMATSDEENLKILKEIEDKMKEFGIELR